MKVFSICSGSSGNCVYVGDGKTNILIDIGCTLKLLSTGLEKEGLKIKDIDALLLSHEHSDHIKGLGVFNRKNSCNIYSKKKTFDYVRFNERFGKVNYDSFYNVVEEETFYINDFAITPFKTYHDAVSPVCFVIKKAGKKFSFLTDTGKFDERIVEHLKGSDIIYLEANHDVRMLEMSSYPFNLKMRILSDIGHLSNDSTADLLSKCYSERTQGVILGHLSNENNMPEIARATVKYEVCHRLNINEQDFNIHVAPRSENSVVLEV